tara:strand:+ start:1908 stop:2879 length:972 start_codon:yes stop_codon:yes gene_type:complete
MKNFGLIGAAGYIAPRHMKAIKDTNNELLVAYDKNDSVGILDSYYPLANFFTEFEQFDRQIEKLKSNQIFIDYVSICSPNYFHDAHIRSAFRWGANAICEKPVVLNPWNLDLLMKMEEDCGKKVFNILQLRYHPSILKLKNKVDKSDDKKIFDVDLTYITPRGNWYYSSWKGNINKSGGISTNIGIHFFDVLQWIFGNVNNNIVHIHNHDRASGYLEFQKARVRWFLSIDKNLLPKNSNIAYRSIKVDNHEIEFSNVFNDLHTESYKQILNNNGYSLVDCINSVEIAYQIRHLKPIGLSGDYHPFAKKPLTEHPFKRKHNNEH